MQNLFNTRPPDEMSAMLGWAIRLGKLLSSKDGRKEVKDLRVFEGDLYRKKPDRLGNSVFFSQKGWLYLSCIYPY